MQREVAGLQQADAEAQAEAAQPSRAAQPATAPGLRDRGEALRAAKQLRCALPLLMQTPDLAPAAAAGSWQLLSQACHGHQDVALTALWGLCRLHVPDNGHCSLVTACLSLACRREQQGLTEPGTLASPRGGQRRGQRQQPSGSVPGQAVDGQQAPSAEQAPSTSAQDAPGAGLRPSGPPPLRGRGQELKAAKELSSRCVSPCTARLGALHCCAQSGQKLYSMLRACCTSQIIAASQRSGGGVEGSQGVDCQVRPLCSAVSSVAGSMT